MIRLANLILPVPLQDGTAIGRRITIDDIDQRSAWRAAYNHETFGEPNTPDGLAQAQNEIARAQQEGNPQVLEPNGQPVAMTAFNAAVPEVVQMGGVYTPPALHGRGYARAVVAVSLRDARAEGAKRAILFTGDDNGAAQAAYRSLGFNGWVTGDWSCYDGCSTVIQPSAQPVVQENQPRLYLLGNVQWG